MPPCSNWFLSQSSWVQRTALALRTSPARVLRNLPLALEMCTPPLELVLQPLDALARRNLPPASERCTQRLALRHTQQELAQQNLPLELERCTPRQATMQHAPQGLEKHSSSKRWRHVLHHRCRCGICDRWCCALHTCSVTELGLLHRVLTPTVMTFESESSYASGWNTTTAQRKRLTPTRCICL